MITTIVLLTLVYAILGKPIGRLVHKLDYVEWARLIQEIWYKIKSFSKQSGRSATRLALRFYYALAEGDLSVSDKALVYAAILYIVIPRDFLPKSIFGWTGVLDDAAAAAFVYSKIRKAITHDIENKVEDTLNDWFGPEVVTELIADLSQSFKTSEP